jgi:AraC family transcriptional regulator
MRSTPIPFFGEMLCERTGHGLRASLGHYPAGTQPLHVHAHPAFSLLVAGRGVDRSRDRAYDQPPLTAVFHPTWAPHANDVGPGGVLGFTLELGPDWLQGHELAERALGGYQVVAPSVASRLACLALLGTVVQAGPGPAADLDAHALELLALLAPAPAGPAPRWLSRGEDFLRTHFRSPVSLRGAAREAGVHPVHFARVFRRRHGCPVSAYVRALRLVEAGALIVGGNDSLAAVACRAGFADQAHLTRCFGRVLGFSPGALRRLRGPARGPVPMARRR